MTSLVRFVCVSSDAVFSSLSQKQGGERKIRLEYEIRMIGVSFYFAILTMGATAAIGAAGDEYLDKAIAQEWAVQNRVAKERAILRGKKQLTPAKKLELREKVLLPGIRKANETRAEGFREQDRALDAEVSKEKSAAQKSDNEKKPWDTVIRKKLKADEKGWPKDVIRKLSSQSRPQAAQKRWVPSRDETSLQEPGGATSEDRLPKEIKFKSKPAKQ